MPERHINFVYKLEGDIGEVDVFNLAPTLLALGELIQESNRLLNPNGQEISVNVKPFSEGSFIVDLSMYPLSHYQQLLDFFTPHSLEELKTLLEIIGLIAGGTAATTVGAVKAIKFLRGKPKAIEELKPGEYRYTSQDDRSITVNGSVKTLLSNSSITNNIYKIYTPLNVQARIDDVKTYLKESEDTAVTVERSEIPSFREYAEPAPALPEPAETTRENTQVGVFLNPKRGAFGNDPKDWSFWRGDGEVLTATIKDQRFLAQIESGEIRPNHSDLLTVTLLEKQKVRGTAVQKPTYEILEVTQYTKGGGDSDVVPVMVAGGGGGGS